jgi:hypothetical protein
MKTNVGIIDRVIRIVFALIFIGLYFTQLATGTLGTVILVFAIILILTSLIGFCPLYLSFGIHTWSKKK